jgi:hypothetical protein
VINWGKSPNPLPIKWKWHLIPSSQGLWWKFNEYIWIKIMNVFNINYLINYFNYLWVC